MLEVYSPLSYLLADRINPQTEATAIETSCPAIPDIKPIRPTLSPLSTRNMVNMDCEEWDANLYTHVQTIIHFKPGVHANPFIRVQSGSE